MANSSGTHSDPTSPALAHRRKTRPIPRWLAFTAALLLLAAPATRAAEGSLYARLGGETVITKVVDETVERCAASPQTRRSFEKVNLKNLKKRLVEQICQLAGGGCAYAGDDMKLVHKGLDINESEFNGLVEILRDALNKAGVSESAKNELLKLLAPMKRDVVTR